MNVLKEYLSFFLCLVSRLLSDSKLARRAFPSVSPFYPLSEVFFPLPAREDEILVKFFDRVLFFLLVPKSQT